MKAIFVTIKKLLRTCAGALGGFVVGGIVALAYLHLKVVFAPSLPTLWIVAPLALLGCVILGTIFPKAFMWYFLALLAWALDTESGGGGGEWNISNTDTWREFLAKACYFLGLPAFVLGVIFSLPVAVGLGLLGIVYFGYEAFRAEQEKGAASTEPGQRAQT